MATAGFDSAALHRYVARTQQAPLEIMRSSLPARDERLTANHTAIAGQPARAYSTSAFSYMRRMNFAACVRRLPCDRRLYCEGRRYCGDRDYSSSLPRYTIGFSLNFGSILIAPARAENSRTPDSSVICGERGKRISADRCIPCSGTVTEDARIVWPPFHHRLADFSRSSRTRMAPSGAMIAGSPNTSTTYSFGSGDSSTAALSRPASCSANACRIGNALDQRTVTYTSVCTPGEAPPPERPRGKPIWNSDIKRRAGGVYSKRQCTSRAHGESVSSFSTSFGVQFGNGCLSQKPAPASGAAPRRARNCRRSMEVRRMGGGIGFRSGCLADPHQHGRAARP